MVSLKVAMATFKDGAHSPIALIVLQALVNLIGQVMKGACPVGYWLCLGIFKETFQRK